MSFLLVLHVHLPARVVSGRATNVSTNMCLSIFNNFYEVAFFKIKIKEREIFIKYELLQPELLQQYIKFS